MDALGKAQLIAFLAVCSWTSAQTLYYVDPDFAGGGRNGAAATPWNNESEIDWSAVNTALASNDVIIYFSALETDGTTQESQGWFVDVQRDDQSTNRLTLDGHAKYNTNDSTPSWTDNPTPIATAYTTNKVFELTGDGSSALGWTRSAAITNSSTVSNDGRDYLCIQSHTSAADTEPGTGANWADYWSIRGEAAAGAWATSTDYHTEVKQDNVTLRGFECTGASARVSFKGDNSTVEYIWIHDVTGQGPGLAILYNSFPDGNKDIVSNGGTNYECILDHDPAADNEPGVGANWAVYWEVTALSADSGAWDINYSEGDGEYDSDPLQICVGVSNQTIQYVRIEDVFGECCYIGSANPGSGLVTEVGEGDFGNLDTGTTIANCYIGAGGVGGNQGDGIDLKNGQTNVTIRDCEFNNSGSDDDAAAALILPQTLEDVDQSIVVERCYFHDSTSGGLSRAIYIISSTHPEVTYKGYNGITIRNCIFDTHKNGISFGSTGNLENIYIHNNTFYNITNAGASGATLDGGTGEVRNNLFLQCNSSGAQTSGFSGWTTMHGNAYDGSSLGLTQTSAPTTGTSVTTANEVSDAAGGSFILISGATSIGIGDTLSTFNRDYRNAGTRSIPWDAGAYEFALNGSLTVSGTITVGP